ncbi:MAG: hypothetical protein ABEH64_04040 [Salinirussus sp.]
MTEKSYETVTKPKSNRPPEEVGREIFRLLRRHDEVRVVAAESEWDVEIQVPE